MLNIVYKIFTTIMATRLNLIINNYIHIDQSGFLKGRNLRDNIRKIMNVKDYARNINEQLLMLFADPEKAFDRDWMFMKQVLVKMGFGINLIKWINLIYSEQTAVVSVEGNNSESFKINRGARQGCPLSPILFNLVIETLAVRIHINRDIGKSCFMGMNVSSSLQESIRKISEAQWAEGTVRYLDIWLLEDFRRLAEVNLVHILNSTRNILANWSKLKVSWMGRVAAVKV